MFFDKTNNYNKKKITIYILTIIIFFIIIISFLLRKNNVQKFEKTQILMNTPVTITLYGKNINLLKSTTNKLFKHFLLIDNLSTRYKNFGNNIYWINENPKKLLKINPIITNQLDTSLYYMKKSNYLFNITLGNLIDLWKEKEKENIIPNQTEINNALYFSKNIDNLILDTKKNTLFLNKKIKLDLGSVAKGYAIEEISNIIKKENSIITGALINAGGNIKVLGSPPRKSKYTVGIQDPFKKNGIIGITELFDNQSISTSGDYERYYTINNKKYSHILSIETGFPFRENHSVSVITNNAFYSDILSTILYLLPEKNGREFLKSIPFKAEVLWINKNKKINKTNNFPFLRY